MTISMENNSITTKSKSLVRANLKTSQFKQAYYWVLGLILALCFFEARAFFFGDWNALHIGEHPILLQAMVMFGPALASVIVYTLTSHLGRFFSGPIYRNRMIVGAIGFGAYRLGLYLM